MGFELKQIENKSFMCSFLQSIRISTNIEIIYSLVIVNYDSEWITIDPTKLRFIVDRCFLVDLSNYFASRSIVTMFIMFGLKLLSTRCVLNMHGSKTHEVHEIYETEAWMRFWLKQLKIMFSWIFVWIDSHSPKYRDSW
jgi:hypothetical protein